MDGTTSIMDLPVDPIGGTSNITLNATEQQAYQPQIPQMQQAHQNISQNNAPVTLDQTTISQIVNGIQQVSSSGVTKLPSRDIPMNTNTITQDPQVQPNYIPQQQSNVDYISNYENSDEIIKNHKEYSSLDELYNEIQTPLLMAVLYFLFQLPFFRKKLFTYFPILFSNDGNLNLNGFIFTSTLFGILFYLISKTSKHLTS